MSTRNVAVIVGSLRKESFNRKLANAVIAIAPDTLRMAIVPIGDLPLYNQDLETESPPEQWVAFRDAIRGVDALLFVTPEYNRSMPGGLKNAIDVGSRPSGKSVWSQQARGGDQRHPGRAWRDGGESGASPDARRRERRHDAGARSVHRAGRHAVRSRRQAHQRLNASTSCASSWQAFGQWIERNAPQR